MKSSRLARKATLCTMGYPIGEIPVVLGKACIDKMIQEINNGTKIGFFEPQPVTDDVPSYAKARLYHQAAFNIWKAWMVDDEVVRIVVEPMFTDAGAYFWRAFQEGMVKFAPLFRGKCLDGTMHIDPDTFQYLCADAFLDDSA